MEKKFELNESQEAIITISSNGDEWKKAQKKEFNRHAANLNIKGFRKGHVPEAMQQRYINKFDVMRDALDTLMNVAYREVLTENNIRPFLQPTVNVNKLDEEACEAVIKVALEPKVELGQYSDLGVEKVVNEVKDEDVEKYLDNLRNQSAMLNVKEAEAALGDTVTINFKGYVDDSPFDGGEAKGYDLKLGSNTFVPGFEDKLVGIKAGENRTINVVFPENYVESLKGKEARFEVQCTDVKETVVPNLDDDFVKEINIKDVNTVDELRVYARKELEKRNVESANSAYLNALISKIIENSSVSMSDIIVENEAKEQLENIKKEAEKNGLSYEDVLSINNKSEAEYMDIMKNNARNNLKGFLVLNELARKENIRVTPEIITARYETLAKQYNMTREEVAKHFESRYNEFVREIHNELLNNFILKVNAPKVENSEEVKPENE